jgi:hypothetical protein
VSLEVDVGVFYNDLSPHGRWIETSAYGWVFVPAVARSWRPYTVGHWVWTDEYGWLWVSDEPYGWATYHYGRWYEDPVYGWAWVPGYEWAPAWVSFRSGGGYMGWAPLPPRVQWAGGFRVGAVQFDAYIEPRHYCFVPERAFVDRGIRGDVVPVSRNTTIINVTRNVTNYTVVDNRIVNRSVSVDEVERVAGRRVQRLRAVQAASVRGPRRERIRGSQVEVFNPVVRKASAERRPPRGTALRERQADRKPEVRAHEKQRQQDAARERRDAQLREQSRRSQEEARRKEAVRAREAEGKRLGQQAQEEKRNRQQLDKRQAQERRAMEHAHDREIRQPQREASARDAEQRREVEHRKLEQRQRQERQDFDTKRASQAREQPGPREREARAGGQQQREPRAPDSREKARRQKPEQQKGSKKGPEAGGQVSPALASEDRSHQR